MSEILIYQINLPVSISISALPVAETSDLVYTAGGGTLFPVLQDDLVQGGKQYYKGNPYINADTYVFKYCAATSITNTLQTVNSPITTKGLFYYNNSTSKYYWDEVYTSPLGLFQSKGTATTLAAYQFKVTSDSGNELYVAISDINIIPKVGDYLVMQRVINTGSFTNGIYTDGINNLPVFLNSENYQFQVKSYSVISTSTSFNVYKLILDKSITPQLNSSYTLVLLNRKDTGIQKELFYDTFEQIEVVRDQLLGDPYNNTTDDTIPKGRKNYLNYTSTQYLGLQSLLNNIVYSKNTPFLVYDINEDIRDKFLPSINTFQFVLPTLLYQNDTRSDTTTPLVLINSSAIINSSNDIGEYSGLYFTWDTGLLYRIGWIFYDLRIIVIDDPEVSTALSYNSNRNYTLPRPAVVPNNGNDSSNPGNGIDITIDSITNGSEVTVFTDLPHNLQDGDAIFISDVYVTDISNNVISASINGYHYVKLLLPNDPFRFKVYDSTLTTPVAGNGDFYSNNVGSIPKVKGTLPRYSYFFTYRIVSSHYTSTAPYAEVIDFNFSKDGKVNNSSVGLLSFTLPNLKWLIDSSNTTGFSATDLEIIIGKYQNTDTNNPQTVTGITNIISFPISGAITNVRNLFTGGIQTDFSTAANAIKITNQDYLNFVGFTGSGTYNKSTNVTGDPTYNIVSNYKHYIYNNGDPVPSTLLTGNGIWTLGNIIYQTQVEQYRTNIQITIPSDQWNDTTNPTYDPTNPFISDRYISEIGLVLTDADTGVNKPMIYTKVAPAIRKTSSLDLSINLSLDF